MTNEILRLNEQLDEIYDMVVGDDNDCQECGWTIHTCKCEEVEK